MNKIIYLVLFLGAVFTTQVASAQKIGYLNSVQLLSEHPKVKAADSELEALQKQLSNKIQLKVDALRKRYAELVQQNEAQTIAPKQFQDQMGQLEQEQLGLQQEEQTLQEQLLQKREELYQPILDEINGVIATVSKENGYTYVLDQSAGAILYADESNDISSLIRAKLNF